jgi:glutamate N-acetyltransferase/amino-acid N-acetyltransferase
MKTLAGGPDHPVVIAPLHSRFLSFPKSLSIVEPEGASPGATHPLGFLAGGAVAGIKESGRPDVGVLAVAPPWRSKASSAGVFTTNAFAAAPVVVNRTECDLGHLVAVVVNSGNANACTGEAGLALARSMQSATAEALGVRSGEVAVGSTGIIGVQLDPALVTKGVQKAAASLKPDGGPEFNRAIMTTDRFPKICAGTVETSAGTVRLGMCAKGAGMIAPAMATMICLVTTDAVLTPKQARSALRAAVEGSFNRVTVDGEMSTNDMVLLLSSGASGVRLGDTAFAEFRAALDALILRLALMIVADGEGATKIMRLRVVGADTETNAARVARAIGDSALVKTAMHGGDPNWGRIVSSAGAAMAGRRLPKASLQLCGVTVVTDGAACSVSKKDWAHVVAEMKLPEIDIKMDLGLGKSSAELFFADMGHEYITINAEYHS